AHGDPASDLPTVLLALDATLAVHGPSGDREVGAADFFTGFFETALAPDEVLTEVRVPKTEGAGWSYQKFHRRSQDWAIVGVAAVLSRQNGGYAHAALALPKPGDRPLRAREGEGRLPETGHPRAAAQAAADGTRP